VKLLEIPPGTDPSVRPAFVQGVVRQMEAIAKIGVAVEAGFRDGRWIIGFTLPGGGGLRFVVTRDSRGWALRWRDSQVITAAGEDLTRDAGGDLTKALALLLPKQGEGMPGAGSVAGESAPAGTTNAVQARRHSVIRN
jgi:hypothetical protein